MMWDPKSVTGKLGQGLNKLLGGLLGKTKTPEK